MKKNFTKLLSLALVVMLCMALAVPAGAISGSPVGDSGGTIGTTLTFDKNLIMKSGSNVPAYSFTFTFAGNDATTAVQNNPFVVHDGKDYLEGITFGSATVASDVTSATTTVTFANNDSVTPGKPGDPTGTPTEGYQYAKKPFTIQFGTATCYTEPGVYRYTLVETKPSTDAYADVTYDTTTYYIDVYVEYTGESPNEELTIGGIIVTKSNPTVGQNVTPTDKVNATPASGGDSEGDFNNELTTLDLTVKKNVTGNQGSHNQEFTFKVEFTGLVPGTYSYTVAGGTPQSFTVETAGTYTLENVKLKHGQTLVIDNLPSNAGYTVTETEATGYTTKWSQKVGTANETAQQQGLTTGAQTLTDSTIVTFENNREGTIPTGILLTIAPFAVLMAVGAAGVLYFVLKKKRN